MKGKAVNAWFTQVCQAGQLKTHSKQTRDMTFNDDQPFFLFSKTLSSYAFVDVLTAAFELDAKARRESHDGPAAKKSRLYFTDSQKRALFAIFKETKKPSKEMQNALAEELGLERGTVANFFMNARRRHPEL